MKINETVTGPSLGMRFVLEASIDQKGSSENFKFVARYSIKGERTGIVFASGEADGFDRAALTSWLLGAVAAARSAAVLP